MRDRAKQKLVLLAMEPYWEHKMRERSYGFRPGRNCHQAIEEAIRNLGEQAKYIIEGDIRKCFDQIKHEELMAKVGAPKKIAKQI